MGRFNLSKGERFKIAKSDGLSKIKVVLDWDSDADLVLLLSFAEMKVSSWMMQVLYSTIQRIERNHLTVLCMAISVDGWQKHVQCQVMELS